MAGWINHRQVEAFHVVMLTGSMTTAGGLLGISQPAVSRLIREFEGKIGFSLFKRHGSNIKPTPEAVVLHREVDQSMRALSRIESAAQGIVQLKSDTLRIAATPGISSVYMGRALRLLERNYPEVTVSISTGTSSAVVDRLRTHRFDLGIAFFPSEVQGLEVEPLDPVEAICVLPQGHRLGDQDEVRVEDLAGVALVCQEKETQTQYKVLSVFRAASIEPMVRVEANFTPMIYKLVESGAGVAIVEPVTALEMKDRAVDVKPFRPKITFEPGIAFPRHRPQSKVARAFATHFSRLFHEDFGLLGK